MIQAEQLHARILEELDLSRDIPDEELKRTLSRMQGDFLNKMTDGVTEEELAVFQRVVDKMADNVGVKHEPF